MAQEIVSPLWDFIFSFLFGDQRNINILAGFLKAVLDLPEDEYDHLTIVNPFLKRLRKKDKLAVVDVRVHTKSKRIIHVELQVHKSKIMRQRIVFYAAKLLWEQLKWGFEYDRLHQVVSIIICNHTLAPEEKEYINSYGINNEKSGQAFTDLIKIIILELSKLPQDENGEPVWPWLAFFKCRTKADFETLAIKHPEMKEAVRMIQELSWVKQHRMMVEQRRLEKYDWIVLKREAEQEAREAGHAAGHAAGHEEGLKEGLKEGHATGLEASRREIAKKMKIRGDSAAGIAEITGLSQEVIEKL